LRFSSLAGVLLARQEVLGCARWWCACTHVGDLGASGFGGPELWLACVWRSFLSLPSRAGWPRRQRPRRRGAPSTRWSSFSRTVPSEHNEICGALFQAAHAGVFSLLGRAGCRVGIVVVVVCQRDVVAAIPDRLGRKVE
jgi:hypothetical protein